MQLAWLLFGSSGCSVAPGSGRMEGLSISTVHLDSLGEVINYIFIGLFVFCAYLMASCYEIVL